MNSPIDTALTLPCDDAVRAAQAAAAGAAFSQAQKLLGDRPGPQSDPEQWNVAVQLLAFRIECAAGFNALGSVIGLRRWGVTWELIARAAGTTRQAAHTRWSAQVRATLDRYGTGEMGGPVADDEHDLPG